MGGVMSTVDLIGERWHRSSFSNGEGGSNCVEVAFVGAVAALRDSKNPDGPVLMMPAASFQGCLIGVTGQ
jgi:hypothetical protein